MPRRNKVKKKESIETASDVLEKIKDGPRKAVIAAILNNFENNAVQRRLKIQKALDDECCAIQRMSYVLMQKIPKFHQKMNFHQYLEFIGKQDSGFRMSFQVEVDQMCAHPKNPSKDTRTKDTLTQRQDSPTPLPTTHRTKKKTGSRINSTKTSTSSISFPAKRSKGQRKGSAARSVQKATDHSSRSTVGLRRSQRISTSLKTPLSAKSFNFSGVFTPKFNPRLPITPAQGLRKPHMGEKVVLMSEGGSPLSHQTAFTRGGPAIIVPLLDGKAITISSEADINRLVTDEDTQENLRFLQKKLADLVKIPLNCYSQ